MKKACNFIKKETLAQVFSGEFCKISNNTFFSQNPSGQLFLKIEINLVLMAGFNPAPGQTWVLFSYGFSKIQLTWIKPVSGPPYPT